MFGGASSSSSNAGTSSPSLPRLTVYRDGKLSVEHHVSINVMDALSVLSGVEKGMTLTDVLTSIQYLYDARIKGGKQPNLDPAVMLRLVNLLLLIMKQTAGRMLTKDVTPASTQALKLFSDFLEIVEEVQTAVEQKSASELRYALKLERRIHVGDEKTPEEAHAIKLLSLLAAMPKFSDWKALAPPSLHAYLEPLVGTTIYASDANLPPEGIYYDSEAAAVCQTFQTNPETGLNSSEIASRLDKYGFNSLPAPPKPSVLKMIKTQLTDFMVIILLIAAVISGGFEDYKATIALVLVVILNVCIGFVQEFKAEKALEALMSLSVPQAVVMRDGKQKVVDSKEIVPGDIIVLDEGAAVPADLRLLEAAQLYIIESVLTGESLPVEKNTAPISGKVRNVPLGDRKNMAFMSTGVSRGRGKGVVVSSGRATEVGKISSALATVAATAKKTPLQKKLSTLGKWLVLFSIILCILVTVIGVARGREAIPMVKVGISLAVSVIPEGLVAVVTITMALGVQRMAKRNAIVRKLPSVETLGAVTTVCSDKTGTLTEGKMKANLLWAGGETFSFSGSGDNPEEGVAITSDGKELDRNPDHIPPNLANAIMISALCNNASVGKAGPDSKSTNGWDVVGDPTEVAMVVASHKTGLTKEYLIANYGFGVVSEFAFDSDRKRMSIIYSVGRNQTLKIAGHPNRVAMVKGASEAILKRCVSFARFGPDGMMYFEAITPEEEQKIDAQGALMASQGLRVIALAVRPMSPDVSDAIKQGNDSNACEKELALVGLIGLIDPPRGAVKDSVRTCHTAGIRVCMITGDHAATATAIAQSLGILEPGQSTEGLVLRGEELDLYTDEDLQTLNPFPLVFARVSPDNKLKIVQALRAMGEIVAMTGDGVNDAPAIKQADVGLAMGTAGTEITKQSADIVLADDNFATIVSAVEEGRRIFDNISKFILYLLSCNTAEIVIMLLSVIIDLPVPFTPIMILWANIIVDIPPSLSLGMEPAEISIMSRPPRNPKKGVFTKKTAAILLYQGISMSMIGLGVFLIALKVEGYEDEDNKRPAKTVAFITLCIVQLAHAFCTRSVEESIFVTGVIANRWMVAAFLFSTSLLVFSVYTPGVNDLLELEPMSGKHWGFVFAGIFIHLALVEIQKVFLRNYLSQRRSRKAFRSAAIEMHPV